jgi:CRISPR/Cas system-associated exonuclease Cas4 (RecB family)
MLLSAGVLTDVEVPVSIDHFRLKGSMDGMNADESWMFELKGTSQFRQVQHQGAMEAHVRQVQAYLLASGLRHAIIVYEDKASQEWTEIQIDRDEEAIEEITQILQQLNEAVDNNTLPGVKRDCQNQTGREFQYCSYASICLSYGSKGAAPLQGGAGTPVTLRPKKRAGRVRERPARA